MRDKIMKLLRDLEKQNSISILMKQKIFWLDLAVCSLWMLVTLANYSWWSLSTHFLMVVTVVMRIILSFSLYRREKRSWIPLIVFSALFALLSVEGPVMSTTGNFADLPFVVLGTDNDQLPHSVTKCILLVWLFLGPLTVYIAGRCQKTIRSSNMTWKDSFGAILWKDKGARLYCLLLLGAICALHSGLAMDNRMCRFACIVLSPLSFYLIARHVTSCTGTSEKNPMVGKLWLMVAAMVIFFCAQRHAEMWRVWMLVTSLSMVAYVCWRTFGKQGFTGICILAIAYLGILLPTVAIGYNQYACIKYGRQDFYPLGPDNILRIKDLKTNKIGLRDRYGMLIEPAYENIVPNSRVIPLGVYELRNNGCYTLYNVYQNEMIKSNVSDRNLQESICQLLRKFCDGHDYGYRDRVEVRVTRKFNSDALLSHVKMTGSGVFSYNEYPDRPFISEDSVTLCAGEFAIDTIERYGDTYQALHYSYDVKRGSVVLYNIDVKTAKENMPQQETLVELAKEIETLLKQ